jgi:glycosyltransferase involved in cell wall biosynthesis
MRSVVLASHNGERFIGDQLDSILSQLGPEDEIIVSDDASGDRTLAIVADRSDARLRVLAHPTRLGYVGNFQRALEHCRGEHIYFSDQDDIWLPDKVATLSAALRRCALVASDAIVVNEQLERLHDSWFALRGATRFEAWPVYLKPCIIGATMACRRAWLRSRLPLPAGVPHDFWLSLNAILDDTLEVVQRPLILYRRHARAHSVSGTDQRRQAGTILTERLRLAAALLRHRLQQHGRPGRFVDGH